MTFIELLLAAKEEANLHSRNCLADTKIFCGNTL